MGKTVVTLSEQDVLELKAILMDEDREEALAFLKGKVFAQVLRKRIFSCQPTGELGRTG